MKTSKPRIKMIASRYWICEGQGKKALGMTPCSSYAHWEFCINNSSLFDGLMKRIITQG